MQLDPAISALLGALIGGVIGVVGTVLTAWFSSRRERTSFRRTTSLQHIDRVRDTYQHALNVLFNLTSGGNPDRATYGNLFAQVSLIGSLKVNDLLQAYLDLPLPRKPPDVTAFIRAMTEHLSDLQSRLN